MAVIYATAPFAAAAAIAWVWMRETPGLATLAAAGLCLAGVTVMVGGSAGSPDLIGDLPALGMTALMALMMVIMRRHPDRSMTLAVGPVSCLQLVATGWVMSAQLDVSVRELVLLAGFGMVHAAATVLPAEGVLRLRAAEAALLGALEGVDLHQLGPAIDARRRRMDVKLAEAPSERQVLLVVDGLVAKEDDSVLQQAPADLGVRLVFQRLAQVDAGNLGADGRCEPFNRNSPVRHEFPSGLRPAGPSFSYAGELVDRLSSVHVPSALTTASGS